MAKVPGGGVDLELGGGPQEARREARMTGRARESARTVAPSPLRAVRGDRRSSGGGQPMRRRACCWEISARSWSSGWRGSSPRREPT